MASTVNQLHWEVEYPPRYACFIFQKLQLVHGVEIHWLMTRNHGYSICALSISETPSSLFSCLMYIGIIIRDESPYIPVVATDSIMSYIENELKGYQNWKRSYKAWEGG